MDVGSNWKVTYDPTGTPLVLVTFGQRIGDELKLQGTQTVDDRPLLDGAAMDYVPRKLVAETFGFTVFIDYADDETARDAILSIKAALPWGQRQPLRIETAGGLKYQYAQAALADATPQMVVTGKARVGWTYNFKAGGFAAV